LKRIAFTGLAMLLGSATVLAASLDGRWGFSVGSCDEPDGIDVMTIDTVAGTIDFYESLCTFTELAEIGTYGLAWQATLSCSGEGETWTVKTLFGISEVFDETADRLAMIGLADGFTSIYFRCPTAN
jgi:hypothetical protein